MIIICEPQCVGFEHVEFNSALISLFQYSFSHEKILFLAEENHLSQVAQKLTDHSIKSVQLIPVTIADRNLPSHKKVTQDLNLCKQVFDIAIRLQSPKVLFSSTTSSHLTATKALLRKYKEISSLIVPHQILETILIRPSFRKPLEWPFWFRFPFFLGNLNRIKYLLLGPSIKQELIVRFPSMKQYITAIHHPYNFNEPHQHVPFNNNTVRFGAFGIGHRSKGTDELFRLANEIAEQGLNLSSEFYLIGPLVDDYLRSLLNYNIKIPSADKALSRQDYEALSDNIDYAVYFYKTSQYRLTASGALFDSFSFLKPIIALRNPFFEYYFELMGDIGYLCSSYDEMKKVIVDLIHNQPIDRYECQRENLLVGRQKLGFKELSEQLQSIWTGL